MSSPFTSPIDSMRSSLIARAKQHSDLSDTRRNAISLPTLYSHVIDRLETILETQWSVTHEKEATYIEDTALKMRIWAGNGDMSSFEDFTTQGRLLQVHAGLALWTKHQLLEIDEIVEELLHNAKETGYHSSIKSTRPMLDDMKNLVGTLIKRTSTSYRSSVASQATEISTQFASSLGEESGRRRHRYSRSDSAASSDFSVADDGYSQQGSSNEGSPEEVSPLSDFGDDLQSSLGEIGDRSSLKEESSSFLFDSLDVSSPESITQICSNTHSSLTQLLDLSDCPSALEDSDDDSPEPSVPLAQLQPNINACLTHLSTLLAQYQEPMGSSNPLHALMQELQLAQMIQALGLASQPLLARFSNAVSSSSSSSSSSSRAASIISKHHTLFAEIVIPSYNTHLEAVTKALQMALDACTSSSPLSSKNLARQRDRAKRTLHDAHGRLAEIDDNTIEVWSLRLHKVKSVGVRSVVERDLGNMRGAWEYLVLVCEWVLQREV